MPSRRRALHLGRCRTIGLALVGVLTLTGCLDDGVPDLESAPVLETLDRLAGTNPAGGALDACPIEEFEELVDNSVELVDESVTRAALDGSSRAEVVVVERTDGAVPVIECEITAPGGALGLRLARSPGERDAHEEFGGALDAVVSGSRSGEVSSFLSDVYRGGEFVRVCIDHDADVDDLCSVDWVDRGNLPEEDRVDDEEPRALVGLWIRGDGALDLDLRLVEERWRLMLPLVIQRLE
ncbi:MAG: hypothetical protein AAGD33_11390 [Actinomycetota bacterium]